MKTTTSTVRRCLGGVFAASAVGGAVVAAMATAGGPVGDRCGRPVRGERGRPHDRLGRPPRRATTSTRIRETNPALTTISQQQAGPQSLGALKTYFDANPQASKDMQALQAPLQGLSARCQLPLTLPQVMGLMQGAQSQAGIASPGEFARSAVDGADRRGARERRCLRSRRPRAAVAPGTGPLPGPSATTPR